MSQGTSESSLVFLEHAAIGYCLSTNGLFLDSGHWLIIMMDSHSGEKWNKKEKVNFPSLLIYCETGSVDLLACVHYLSKNVLPGPTA